MRDAEAGRIGAVVRDGQAQAGGQTLLPLVPVLAICASLCAIFLFDIVIAPDDVSIAFAYVVPIGAVILAPRLNVYWLATATTALSLAGLVAFPVDAGTSFYGNRAIAILTQWLAAGLVMSRLRTERLLAATLAAERQKAEQQQRFLDIVSHEIGTSLTTIDGQAYRLVRRNSVLAPAEIVERADKVRGAVRHVRALLQHIQLVAEADEGTLKPQRRAIAPAELIEDVLAQLRDANPRAVILSDLAALPALLPLDEFMIRQVVDNVVANAIKYSPEASPVRVEAALDGEYAALSVVDQGRGIAAEDIGQVFSVYYRGRNSLDIHGTGVGLYVAERFVAAMGGTISIDSRIGQGTTVMIRLPLRAAGGLP